MLKKNLLLKNGLVKVSSMKRILAFCFFPAFVPPSNGGESRVYNFYKSLSKFHHITLLTSTHPNVDEEKVYHGSNFIERRIPKDIHFAQKWDELTPFSSGGDLSAACITASSRFHTLMHDTYLEEYADADLIIHDFPFTVDYDLFFGVDDKIRIYNAHNCETLLYKSLHPASKSQPIWDLVKTAEVKMLSGCDVVLYCNEADLDEFKQLVPDAKYSSIFTPNGMSPLFRAERNLGKRKIDSVVFIGSGHPPNVEAAFHITDIIAPGLPDITFHIIGNCLPKGKYPKNVVRHGFVDDAIKVELLCKADLAINPMDKGSGSNVKVFDLFSYAVPVLSSEFGMRGIDAMHEKNCLIAPVSEFVKIIKLWSERYEELQQIGINGREFALKIYSWDVIAQKVSKALRNVKKNSGWTEPFILALNDYDSFKSSGGGGVRTRGIYSAINSWCPVVFMCFSDNNDELVVRYENRKTVVFNIPKTKQHIKNLQAVNSLSHISAADIIAHRQCRSNTLLVSIYNILKQLCRNIVVEHPYLASMPIQFNDRFVYSSQNCEAQIKKDLLQSHPLHNELICDVENLERKTVESAAVVIAVSEEDADLFIRGGKTSGPVITVPNGASQPVKACNLDLETAKKSVNKEKSAVFVGSAHLPNIEAAQYIVDILAPACPLYDFHIIGTVCTAISVNGVKNVHLWGILSESMKSAVMQSCSIALNTVVSGGGSNIKLADYFANGLYVVTTPFGLRGYSEKVLAHLLVAELKDFQKAINEAFLRIKNEKPQAVFKRRQLFDDNLSMTTVAQKVVTLLKNLEEPKKKVLFVTYRYTHPTLGGAEIHIEKLIAALDATNDFQIDIIAPEISKIENRNRFTEHYQFDKNMSVKTGLLNVRFARFPVDSEINTDRKVSAAWGAQPLFERNVYLQLTDSYTASGLAWGWGEPEGNSTTSRWALASCGLHLQKKTVVHCKCYAPEPIVIWVKDQDGYQIKSLQGDGSYDLDFTAEAGMIEITASAVTINEDDARPLAFLVLEIRLDDQAFDLGQPLLPYTVNIKDEEWFQILDKAQQQIRAQLGIDLTAMRGPFSPALESYLINNTKQYDLVITHNNIFRPAVVAVEQANKNGVPVISIPHAHLDDDFYHFPDVHKSIINSDLVLAAPHITCDFYKRKGARTVYHTPGIDNSEPFTSNDIMSFKEACSVNRPFVLVLGRKSGAKGYQQVIDAVEILSQKIAVQVVMIGPDDDGLPVNSACATYLGRQPREVVRGALLSCQALVNMSSSESFGIVLLEAWMAGKPVIVNNACAAFHDLAIDNHNALMVDDSLSLQNAISKIVSEPGLCEKLANNGAKLLKDYDWSRIGSSFVASCKELINSSRKSVKSSPYS